MLANVTVQGGVDGLSMYRDSYRVNCGSSSAGGTTGVWMEKDNSTYGPYSYKLVLDGETYDLSTVNWDFRSGLLDNVFPLTELQDPRLRLQIKLISFAPVSADGADRLRGLVYGLLLKNRSNALVEGRVKRPMLSYPLRNKPATRDDFDPGDFELDSGSSEKFSPEMTFSLKPGESLWVPTLIFAPGEPVPAALKARGALAWLRASWQYYRGLLGRLSVPGHPFLGDFYEREVMQALQSIALSDSGQFAGSNWGSSPTTRQIWMKDCYYSCLPFTALDPALARKFIPWFERYGIRPDGVEMEGGINHSLGLTVASPLLASLYYARTADKAFLLDHPELKTAWTQTLDAVLASRVDPDVWLFPTRWISDGAVTADYHTGSNVAVWAAIAGSARLLNEVYGDATAARARSEAARQIQASLLAKTRIESSEGLQFVDEANRDGRQPEMLSNGEESDVTLVPFYGFVPYDDQAYLNFMRFSVSTRNPSYTPRLHALSWREKVPSTSPGYNKGLCAGLDEPSEFGDHGYYTELRRVTDLDGSVWWWSYGKDRHPIYGRLTRAYGGNGKAGWTAGVHSVLFPSRFLGVTFDAPARRFAFAPFRALGDFEWWDFPEGNDHFDLGVHYEAKRVSGHFRILGEKSVAFEAELPVDGTASSVIVDGKPVTFAMKHYLGSDTVCFVAQVSAASACQFEVLK